MRRALIVIAVMLLSACRVDTTIDISMDSDGSGEIKLTAIADAEVVAKAPGLAEDLRFDDAEAVYREALQAAPTNRDIKRNVTRFHEFLQSFRAKKAPELPALLEPPATDGAPPEGAS
jgi:hypothetical protein